MNSFGSANSPNISWNPASSPVPLMRTASAPVRSRPSAEAARPMHSFSASLTSLHTTKPGNQAPTSTSGTLTTETGASSKDRRSRRGYIRMASIGGRGGGMVGAVGGGGDEWPVVSCGTRGSGPGGSGSYSGGRGVIGTHHINNGGPPPYPFTTSPPTASVDTVAPSTAPDVKAQRRLLEPILHDHKLIEGDFWYIIVAEWLEQLKRYLGIASTRKFYNQRVVCHPGPVSTRKDYAHNVDAVHEDAWRLLVQWYGLAEGHKPMKLVVYNYNRVPGIEHNVNSFKLMACNAPPEEFHIARFSKMEKIGHVEYRLRELYRIPRSQKSRLWAKADNESDWKPLLQRDKAIGKVLSIDSDFTRPIIAIEVCESGHVWGNTGNRAVCTTGQDTNSSHSDVLPDEPTGPLYERDIFADVTSAWEVDIHDQIDSLGKSLTEKLHSSFGKFVRKAKLYVDERENGLREREREISEREEYIQHSCKRNEEKEQRLSSEIEACQNRMHEFERIYEAKEVNMKSAFEDREALLKTQQEQLITEREQLDKDKEAFRNELKRMSELHKIQDSRLKLDIGGHLFTTSLLTLHRDPNSMLAAMFSGRHELKTEPDGSYFIDRDGAHFRYILNYLRDGGMKDGTLPANDTFLRELQTESEYYQLTDLVDYLDTVLYKRGLSCTDTVV